MAAKQEPASTSIDQPDQRFIPWSRADIISVCSLEPALQEQQQDFETLCDWLIQRFHYRFHQQLEQLKRVYAPVNPDSDTRALPESLSQQIPQRALPNFADALKTLLQHANYEQLTEADIEHALTEESLFNIRLQVNFEEFEEFLLFARGVSQKRQSIRSFFGLRSREVQFTHYDRVALYIKFKDESSLNIKTGDTPVFTPGSSIIKLFQNVPRADLEMLFPNTQVRMKTLDKWMIGLPALASSAAVIFTKMGSTLLLIGSLIAFWLGFSDKSVVIDQTALLALGAGMASLGGVLWREFNKFKNRKIRFMKTLTENLYFKNLDNNEGVIHRLIDTAEEEECKEAILGWTVLYCHGGSMTEAEWDAAVEQWAVERFGYRFDFEISDSIRKLSELELITNEAGRWRAVGIKESLSRLDQQWDKLTELAP